MKARDPAWGALIAGEAGVPSLLHVGAGPAAMAQRCRGILVYLATPYSREVLGPDGAWCPARSIELGLRAADRAARLARVGVTAVSPIAQAADMVHVARPPIDPLDDAFWEAWCRPLLAGCGAVAVPDMPGWDRSRGIWHEVTWALERNMPVFVEASVSVEAGGP